MSGFAPPEACWASIGVRGDQSCPELQRVVHCHNCEVLFRAAATLLTRPAPDGYAAFFAPVVAAAAPAPVPEESVVLFRLGEEWLALPTPAFAEFADLRPVHRLAHRTHTLLSGLVNIRGQLHLCVALDRLLEIAPAPARQPAPVARLAVVAWQGATWVFRVDEVHGVHRFPRASLASAPATLPPALAAVTRGVFRWGDRQVTCLNGDTLALALRRVMV